MSQQAKYITNLERALEGLIECFEESGDKLSIEVFDTEGVTNGLWDVSIEAQDAWKFAVETMYGAEALMEDEI